MEFGFLSSFLPEYCFEQVVDFAADNGFACVEMAGWPVGEAERRYAGVTHINMSELTDERVEYIKEYTRIKNVFISGIGYYPNALSADLEQRQTAIEHIKACILGAERLGIPVVNTFIGKNRELPMDANWKEFLSVWPELIQFAEEHQVKVAIENCPMYFWTEWPSGENLACTPAFWRKMFAEIPSNYFGLNYDPSHLAWQRMDYVKQIYNFNNKLFHFHVKDAKFYQEKFDEVGTYAAPLEYYAPKLPGLGDIDWGKVVSALNDVGYKGAFILEIEDRAYEDTLEDRLNALKLSRDYISNFIR
jgi:sugar phosphate isomerase/epimerase